MSNINEKTSFRIVNLAAGIVNLAAGQIKRGHLHIRKFNIRLK